MSALCGRGRRRSDSRSSCSSRREIGRLVPLRAAFKAGAGRTATTSNARSPRQDAALLRDRDHESRRAKDVATVAEQVSRAGLSRALDSRRYSRQLGAAHLYEEPAIDAYPLTDGPSEGPGVAGRLATPEGLETLARRVGESLAAGCVQIRRRSRAISLHPRHRLRAGDDFLAKPVLLRADALSTGEGAIPPALEAESLGIGLIVAGHHTTERPGVEDPCPPDEVFPSLTVWPSRREADPLRCSDS